VDRTETGDPALDPFSFDIDRYLPPRDEHRSPGLAGKPSVR